MLLTYLVLLKANLSRAFSNCFRGGKRLAAESACMSSLVLRSSVMCVLYRQEKQCVLPPPLLLFSGVIAGGTVCLPLWGTHSTVISALFLSLWNITFKQLLSFTVFCCFSLFCCCCWFLFGLLFVCFCFVCRFLPSLFYFCLSCSAS